jgi:hypothetical protein
MFQVGYVPYSPLMETQVLDFIFQPRLEGILRRGGGSSPNLCMLFTGGSVIASQENIYALGEFGKR